MISHRYRCIYIKVPRCVRLLQVAGEDFKLRDLTVYATAISRRGGRAAG
ncbi:hypothetical protein [Candidatus Palauibacter sp.]